MGFKLGTFAEFKQDVAKYDYVAIGETLVCDDQTSINIADRFCESENFYLLESATEGPDSVARYSFIGVGKLAEFTSAGRDLMVETSAGKSLKQAENDSNGVTLLSEMMRTSSLGFSGKTGKGVEESLVQTAGATGYISYDYGAVLEPTVGKLPPKKIGLYDIHFIVPEIFIIFDRFSQNLHVFLLFECADKQDVSEAVFDNLCSKLKQLTKDLSTPHFPPRLDVDDKPVDFDRFDSAVSEKVFKERVIRCLDEISRGEVFQIQIGNRMSCATEARPIDIFRHLRKLNPSPYMFFYKYGKHHIIGASPEMMVNLEGSTMVHRPIAGTRKRTWEVEKDKKMISELITSSKERAEHIMLVDLGRNDISRVCEPESVTVDDLMIVEKYSHVFHMVSQVSGKLDEKYDAGDAMVASFPNGTVVGAPKIRAMQLIAEIEDFSREFYAGSLGVFQFSGELKSTIMIRTMHLADGIASTQASAGVVFDSTPDEEWLETKNKMAACMQVMQNTK